MHFELWLGFPGEAVDGGLLEGVGGAGVFFGVFETAVAEETGEGFYVGSVVEDVDGEGVARTVPRDVFVDSGMSHPVAQLPETAGVGREIEDMTLFLRRIGGHADQREEGIVEGYHYPTRFAVPFGLCLLEFQETVGNIYVGEG